MKTIKEQKEQLGVLEKEATSFWDEVNALLKTTKAEAEKKDGKPDWDAIEAKEVEAKEKSEEAKTLEKTIGILERQREREARAVAVEPGVKAISDKDKEQIKKYSFLKAGLAASKNIQPDGFEREMHQETVKDHREAGIDTPSGVGIPRLVFGLKAKEERILTVATEGTDIVETTFGGLIPALRANPIVVQAGARVLSGLQGDQQFPRNNGNTSGAWEGETDAGADTTATFNNLTLTPTRFGLRTDVAKKALLQSNPDLEQFVRDEIILTIENGVDVGAINGSGASNQPTGVLNQSGIGDVAGGTNGLAPAYSHLVDLETDVTAANGQTGGASYVTTPGAVGTLKKTELTTGGTGFVIWQGQNEVNGYPILRSTNVPSNLTKGTGTNLHAIIFGLWRELLIGQWGGMDLLMDPYTQADTATVRFLINIWIDVGARQAAQFSAMQDAIIS